MKQENHPRRVMESLRIYVPAMKMDQPGVEEALSRVTASGATLYPATGAWPQGLDTLVERVVVVEVLDCDAERQEAVDDLATALLEAGEEAVLIARQETATRFVVRSGKTPAGAART
jgi:hypothetical protein